MRLLPRSLEKVIDQFAKLPSVGPRTAERLSFYLLKSPKSDAHQLGQALLDLHTGIKSCIVCHNLCEEESCAVCQSSDRERHILAVVEEPLDVIAIEKTGQFRGLYHVLGGVISPIDGIGPDELQIGSLLKRLADEDIKEIILATNPSTEGDTTALYIQRQLEGQNVTITRLARGLPVGGDLEYADQITLGRALQGRQRF